MSHLVNTMELLYSFLVGGGVGLVFGFFALPIPAPPVLAGIIGIFGIWTGYKVIGFIEHFFTL